MTAVDAWPALERAAGCGPFFDLVRWDDDEPPTAEAGWHPMTEFADHRLGVDFRVAAARESLVNRGLDGAVASPAAAARIAASVTFLGLAARLLSPTIGALLAAGVLPDLGWDRLYWCPAAVGVLPLATGPATGRLMRPANPGSGDGNRPDPDTRLILGTTVAPVLGLGEVVAERFGVPPGIVAGNVASALAGAVDVVAKTYPWAADASMRLGTALLAAGELAGKGEFLPPAPAGRPRFRRRSCCLLYRVGGAGLCGDCVLHAHPQAGDARR